MSIFNEAGKEFTYIVAGIFENLPLNSSFYYEVLTHFENYIYMWEIAPVHNSAREDFQISVFRLQPLYDVGHDSGDIWSDWWVRSRFHPAAVMAPKYNGHIHSHNHFLGL